MGDDSSMIKIGPVGCNYSKSWDEKGHGEIVQILISHGDGINAIQFQYAENGSLKLSETHGTNSGFRFDVVKLNHPTEYITWISASRGDWSHCLCSITFGTNLGEYGPFGGLRTNDKKPKDFIFKLGDDRQFGGFYGTLDNSGIASIGVYLKPNTNLNTTRLDSSSTRKIYPKSNYLLE